MFESEILIKRCSIQSAWRTQYVYEDHTISMMVLINLFNHFGRSNMHYSCYLWACDGISYGIQNGMGAGIEILIQYHWIDVFKADISRIDAKFQLKIKMAAFNSFDFNRMPSHFISPKHRFSHRTAASISFDRLQHYNSI